MGGKGSGMGIPEVAPGSRRQDGGVCPKSIWDISAFGAYFSKGPGPVS